MDKAFSRQRIHVNGVNLNVTTAGDPSAQMMLFLHGFPEYSGMWHGLMRAFMDRAYCVAPDQRGYNGSDAPSEVSFYRAPNMAKDAAALIAQLSSSGKAIVIGHDWGASVAYALTISAPQLVERLIIINGVHAGPFQQALLEDTAQVEASQYFHGLRAQGSEDRLAANGCEKLFAMFSRFSPADWMTDEDRSGYLAAWSHPGALRGMVNWYRASPINVPRPGESVQGRSNPFADTKALAIRPPHLLIWGDRDGALMPSSHHGLEAYCDDLTRVHVPEGDHWIVNAMPETVQRAIADYLG